jgi:hypothetical protein
MRKLVRGVRSAKIQYATSIAEAADTVWALNSSELYIMLTLERGWTPRQYERWLARSLSQAVLDQRWGVQGPATAASASDTVQPSSSRTAVDDIGRPR